MLQRCRSRQARLQAACKAGDATKVARYLDGKDNLDLTPCLAAAHKRHRHAILALLLLHHAGPLDTRLLQDIALEAAQRGSLPVFEAALAHPSFTLDTAESRCLRGASWFGRNLLHMIWRGSHVALFEALLRLQWRETVNLACRARESLVPAGARHWPMRAALLNFMTGSRLVRVTDVFLLVRHTNVDDDLREALLRFLHGEEARGRACLALTEAFLQAEGHLGMFRQLPRFMGRELRALGACEDYNQAVRHLYGLLSRHIPPFLALMRAVSEVRAGRMKAGQAELALAAFRRATRHEPHPLLAVRLHSALGLAMLAGVLRPLRLLDALPAIQRHLQTIEYD